MGENGCLSDDEALQLCPVNSSEKITAYADKHSFPMDRNCYKIGNANF